LPIAIISEIENSGEIFRREIVVPRKQAKGDRQLDSQNLIVVLGFEPRFCESVILGIDARRRRIGKRPVSTIGHLYPGSFPKRSTPECRFTRHRASTSPQKTWQRATPRVAPSDISGREHHNWTSQS
jgi:hypothetical protein